MSGNQGKYFGVCTSWHHSKGCSCPACPSCPEKGKFMFCSKGKSAGTGEKAGCLCKECEIHRKFRFEGDYFCRD
ncbi:MAG: DUF2769 domain-containing protein [Methanolobus sp.]|nr:DUF2769 domain-containing protein [Methanolobus sp.]